MNDEIIASIERRLRDAEDKLALYQLMSAYGPLVDSGDAKATSELWTEDGVYDWGGGPRPVDAPAVATHGAAGAAYNRAEIAAMVDGKDHHAIIDNGAGHVIGLPHILLDGDTAVATGYSRLYRWNGTDFTVWRVAANRWEFVRTAEGWRITSRTNRPLNGNDEPRQILRSGVPT
jgi:hypothetical protein